MGKQIVTEADRKATPRPVTPQQKEPRKALQKGRLITLLVSVCLHKALQKRLRCPRRLW